MGINFKKWALVGLHILEGFVPALTAVEAAGRQLGLSGPQKQQAVVDIIKSSLSVAEQLGVFDDEVEKAAKEAVDAVVHLQNVISQKAYDKGLEAGA